MRARRIGSLLRDLAADLARSAQAPRRAWTRPLFVAALFLSYILFLLWKPLQKPDEIMGGFDMAIYYPFKLYWIESLKRLDPAYWNPYLSIGQPFMGFPSVGAYAPFNFLYFLFPAPLAFTWNTLCHLFLAAFGAYVLLRGLGAAWESGFLAGMGFAFGGYVLTRGHGGQPAVWWAASWIPWALHFLILHLREGRLRPLGIAGACAALSFFEGYPQICLYLLLAGGLLILGAWLAGKIPLERGFLSSAIFLAVFVGLSLSGTLPAFDFISRSDRWNWGYGNIMTDYLAPLNLRHFWEPNFLGSAANGSWHGRWGYHEMVNYVGLVPFALFLISPFFLRRDPRLAWFLGVAALFTALSLGDSTAPTQALFRFFFDHVPGFDANRSIGRMMIVADLAMVCAAGLVLDAFLKGGAPWGKASATGRAPWRAWAVRALILLTVIDLARYGKPLITSIPAGSYTDKSQVFPTALTDVAILDPTFPRILPSNTILANLSWDLAQLSSPDTTFIREFAEFKNSFPGDYDSQLADLINLKYLYRQGPLNPKRWKEWQPSHYVNQRGFPRAFLAGGFRLVEESRQAYGLLANPLFDARAELLLEREPGGDLQLKPGIAGEAKITDYRDNELVIDCKADRPCLLFLSDPFFPGWKAWVDGKLSPILRADGAFRAVLLSEAGEHQVRMAYRPLSIPLGFWISLLCWGLLLWACVKRGSWALADLERQPSWVLFRTAVGFHLLEGSPWGRFRSLFDKLRSRVKRSVKRKR